MKFIKRIIYFLAAFVLGSGVLFGLSLSAGLFEVRRIPIELVSENGDGPESAQQLKQRLESKIRKFARRKIWEVDLGDLHKQINADEWVKRARISRVLPNRIEVSIEAKTPVLLLMTDSGELRPITQDASLLRAIRPSSLPDVPILRGQNAGRKILDDPEARLQAIEFMEQLPEDGPLGRAHISEVEFGEDGYTLTLIGSRTQVKLGEQRIRLKVQRVTQVLNYLTANQLKGRVIDASFSKKVLVRLRKDK